MATRSSRRNPTQADSSSSSSPSAITNSSLAAAASQSQQQQQSQGGSSSNDRYQYNQSTQDDQTKREHEQSGFGRHVRASSDPISRGGNFSLETGHLLDQEPNPFEQSFSGPEPSPSTVARVAAQGGQTPSLPGVTSRRARSISPNSLANRQTPGGTNKITQFPMMPTPSTDLAQFGWPQGSFTPSMMAGGHFDPSMLRTGLTPLGGVTSGNGGVSFPPPSPATAALFAMMTNNTPGTAEGAAAAGLTGGGPRPHEGPNEANNFDASFARAAEVKNEGSGAPPAPEYAALHRSSLSNGRGGVPSGVMHPSHLANQVHPTQNGPYYAQQQQQQYGQPPTSYGNAAYSQNGGASQPPGPLHLGSAGFGAQTGANGGAGNQNPLYLLSQASSHNDDAVVAAAALSGLATPGFHGHVTPLERIAQEKAAAQQAAAKTTVVAPASISTRGTTASVSNGASDSPVASANGGSQAGTGKGKRGAAAGSTATNKRKKAGETDADSKKATPAKKPKRASVPKAPSTVGDEEGDELDDMMMMDDGDSQTSPRALTGGETEEEKRKNFLERNRQAALKCRQRKKAWLQNLQNKVESLTTDNDTLQATVTNLKEEIQSLRAILQAHANCPVANGPDRRASAQNYPPNGQQRY